MSKQKVRPNFLAPITQNGKLPDLNDIAAICLRNAGDSTVELNNGAWTLDSKETISLNVTEDMAGMDWWDITVSFTGGTTNKLQIVILKMADC